MGEVAFFWKGLVLGVAIAAPVGPIGILCIRRTLAYGQVIGFLTGLGAAVADALFGAIAAFGVLALSELLLDHTFALRILGGIFLLYLGLRMLIWPLPAKAEAGAPVTVAGGFRAFLSGVVLTVTNPVTVIASLTVFAAIGFSGGELDTVDAVWVVAGVALGSAAWWLGLSSAVSLFGRRITPRTFMLIDRVAGCLLLAFGLYAFGGALVPGLPGWLP